MTIGDIMEKAKKFAKDHVAECSLEILNWNSTGLLSGDRLTELAEILKDVDPYHALTLAQNLVKDEALRIAAKIPDEVIHSSKGPIHFKT